MLGSFLPWGAEGGGLVQRYFQGEDEEMPAGFAESPTEPAEEPSVMAERLWREARALPPLLATRFWCNALHRLLANACDMRVHYLGSRP